jgi:hypothetical protein
VTFADVYPFVAFALQGIIVAAVVILVLFIGMSIGFDFTKLRPGGRKTMTVRNLEEALGQPVVYLPPDTPRGTTDQLANSQHGA